MDFSVKQSQFMGMNAYATQSVRHVSARQTADNSLATNNPAKNDANHDAKNDAKSNAVSSKQTAKKEFSLKIGKFGVSYSAEEPVDTQKLAETALKQVNNQRAQSYRVEMEIAALREEISQQPRNTTPQLPDPMQGLQLQGERHVRSHGAKTYAKTEASLDATELRPGVRIGVV